MPLRHAALQFSDNEQTFFWLVFSSLRVLKGGSRLIYRFSFATTFPLPSCYHTEAWETSENRRLPTEAAQRFKTWAAIHSFASYATESSASRSFRPKEVGLLHLPDRFLYDLLKVAEKNGPFLLVFSQIVALTIPRRSVG